MTRLDQTAGRLPPPRRAPATVPGILYGSLAPATAKGGNLL